MYSIYVAIKINGEISTGFISKSTVTIGEILTILLHDENGNLIEQTGAVVEIF
jgi:hypothetical protein